jgi:competence protein ComEA
LRAWLRLSLLAAAVVALGLAMRPGAGRLRRPPDVSSAWPVNRAGESAEDSGDPGAVSPAADAPRVHLNRATRSELETLPGIGPALAGRILEFRASHGPFRDPSELLLVRGIGPGKWAALKPLVEP